MVYINTTSNSTQQLLNKLDTIEQNLKKQKKKLDQKTKKAKTLRALETNKSSKSGKKPAKHSDQSFMYAMVVALAAQMNQNLKAMGAQAEHVKVLDNNNMNFTKSLNELEKKSESITNYTDPNSLAEVGSISAEMNIIGNKMTSNQSLESKDTAVAQAMQTNISAEKSIGQNNIDTYASVSKLVRA